MLLIEQIKTHCPQKNAPTETFIISSWYSNNTKTLCNYVILIVPVSINVHTAQEIIIIIIISSLKSAVYADQLQMCSMLCIALSDGSSN